MAGSAFAILLNEQTHVAPIGHPENAVRLRGIAKVLEAQIASGQADKIVISDRGLEPVMRIHDPRYLSALRDNCANGAGHPDADTYFCPGSFEAAVSVVNAVLSAIDRVFLGESRHVLVLGRPPGHHAEKDHAMGFCLLNTIAIGAQYALDRCGAKRVVIVDFDVHHGNGTQNAFYDRADVLYISSHRYPFYPGSGNRAETGVEQGKGFTVNIPLTVGAGDEELVTQYAEQVVPALNRFQPDILLVSAGFDTCYRDPLGGLNITGYGFCQIGKLLCEASNQFCYGRIVSVLEGGYDEQGNMESITAYLNGIGYD